MKLGPVWGIVFIRRCGGMFGSAVVCDCAHVCLPAFSSARHGSNSVTSKAMSHFMVSAVKGPLGIRAMDSTRFFLMCVRLVVRETFERLMLPAQFAGIRPRIQDAFTELRGENLGGPGLGRVNQVSNG